MCGHQHCYNNKLNKNDFFITIPVHHIHIFTLIKREFIWHPIFFLLFIYKCRKFSSHPCINNKISRSRETINKIKTFTNACVCYIRKLTLLYVVWAFKSTSSINSLIKDFSILFILTCLGISCGTQGLLLTFSWKLYIMQHELYNILKFFFLLC